MTCKAYLWYRNSNEQSTILIKLNDKKKWNWKVFPYFDHVVLFKTYTNMLKCEKYIDVYNDQYEIYGICLPLERIISYLSLHVWLTMLY